MISPEFKEIIVKLTQKTKDRKARWYSISEDQFALKLKEGTVVIDKSYDSYTESTNFQFSILNQDGVKIESLVGVESDDLNLLDDLFEVVRRSYYRVEETIKSIASEVNNDDEIGDNEVKDKSKNINDSDLPF